MKRSVDRIMTTHVGSLPRPSDLVELYGDDATDNKLLPRLRSAVTEVVRRQAECGIDVVNDGEFGKAMRRAVDFGAWWSYVYDRLAGFELRQEQAKPRPCRATSAEPLTITGRGATPEMNASVERLVRAPTARDYLRQSREREDGAERRDRPEEGESVEVHQSNRVSRVTARIVFRAAALVSA
jgi:hypothetical protein